MVKAKKKPISELKALIEPYQKVLNIGCGGCVSVCLAGGQKEVNVLNAELALGVGRSIQIEGYTVERQCRPQYVEGIKEIVKQFDCLLSMACGAGAQLLAETYPNIPVFPAVNTIAIGVDRDVGIYEEKCRACGDCVIGYTGGICPITRCAKGLFNGPCGGVHAGICEVSHTVACAWVEVYKRLSVQNRLDFIHRIREPIGWQNQVQRLVVQDDYVRN
ncbi:MAG TPA: methylenetetrahydrofolate reductase C-terminal domain-containing protein [Desulfobacterales bacterium]|nr:methylenetetrahydrofolate reductase C-terminal domain-containing protein [Desulfobacterales bacterium]